jgi:hypothetical protein
MAVEAMLGSTGGPGDGSTSPDRYDFRSVLAELAVVAQLDRAARYGRRPLSDEAAARASAAAEGVERALRRRNLRIRARRLGVASSSWPTEGHGTPQMVRASYSCGADDAEGVRLGADRSGV